MEFRYPKARLFAYDKLAGGDSCYSVMIQAVTDAGLLPDDVASSLKTGTESGAGCASACGSLTAAEKIIQAFMRQRHGAQGAQEATDAALKQLTADVESWKRISRFPEGVQLEQNESCRNLTPVVLDFLLQQIMRH